MRMTLMRSLAVAALLVQGAIGGIAHNDRRQRCQYSGQVKGIFRLLDQERQYAAEQYAAADEHGGQKKTAGFAFRPLPK